MADDIYKIETDLIIIHCRKISSTFGTIVCSSEEYFCYCFCFCFVFIIIIFFWLVDFQM